MGQEWCKLCGRDFEDLNLWEMRCFQCVIEAANASVRELGVPPGDWLVTFVDGPSVRVSTLLPTD